MTDTKEHSLNSIQELENYLHKCCVAYYHSEDPIEDDHTFDQLCDVYRSKTGKEYDFFATNVGDGTTPSGKRKVKLPLCMPSQNKVKTESELNAFLAKFPTVEYFVVSDKLDGISIGLFEQTGTLVAATKHKNDYGVDISHLLPSIKENFPTTALLSVSKARDIVMLRGEILHSKHQFLKRLEVEPDLTHCRSAAAGLVNADESKDAVKFLSLVLYEVFQGSTSTSSGAGNLLSPSEQMTLLQSMSLPTVWNLRLHRSEMTFDRLCELFTERMKSGEFEVDGLVVAVDAKQSTEFLMNKVNGKVDNPSYSIAFKPPIALEVVESTIVDILWRVTKRGRYFPTAQIVPVKVGSSEVTYVTFDTPRRVFNTRAGHGSRVKVTLRGTVIPHLEEIEPSDSGEPKMPSTPWRWVPAAGKDGVEKFIEIDQSVAGTEAQDRDKRLARTIEFFAVLDTPGFGKETVKSFFDFFGYDLSKILNATVDQIMKMPRVQEKSATKRFEALQGVVNKEHDLEILLRASSCFDSSGRTKLAMLVEHFPNCVETSPTEDELLRVDGFGPKTVPLILQGLDQFRVFIAQHPQLRYRRAGEKKRKAEKEEEKTGTLTKKPKVALPAIVVVTGFRPPKEWVEFAKENGCKLTDTWSTKADLLVVKGDQGSIKCTKAAEKGIKIVSQEEFAATYGFK